MDSPHKGPVLRSFDLLLAWKNCRKNNRVVGDLRRHEAFKWHHSNVVSSSFLVGAPPGNESSFNSCSTVKFSCRGRCSGDLFNSGCYCDKSCIVMGDCCFDFLDWCDIEGATRTKRLERDVLPDQYEAMSVYKDLVSCVNVTPDEKIGIELRLISKCTNREHSGLVRKCEGVATDVVSQVPVMVQGVAFKNIFCVRCNGYNDKDMSPLGDIRCEGDEDEIDNAHPSKIETDLGKFDCKLALKHKGNKVLAKIMRFDCLTPRDYECNSKDDTQLCNSYTAYISVSEFPPVVQKNMFCARCAGYNQFPFCNELHLRVQRIEGESSSSWLFDFTGIYREAPVPSSCAVDDKYEFLVTQCSPRNATLADTNGTLAVPSANIYTPTVTFQATKFEGLGGKQGRVHFAVDGNRIALRPIDCPVQLTTFMTRMTAVGCAITDIDSIDFLRYLDAIHYGLLVAHNVRLGLRHILLANHDPQQPLECPNNYTLEHRRGVMVKMQDGSLAVWEAATDHYYTLDMFPVYLSQRFPSGFDGWVVICNHYPPETCTFQDINTEAMKIDAQGHLQIGTNYALHPDQFSYISDRMIRVCAHLIPDRLSLIQILTMLVYTVSTICLLLTFTIYCLHKRLRTVPGKLLMNLMLTLSFAHMGMILSTSSALAGSTIPCLLLAAIQHYMWLASFSWMGIIGFDIFLCLSAVFSTFNDNTKGKFYIRYSLFGWTLPVIAVLICVILTLIDVKVIRYDLEHRCWLANSTSVLYMYAIPIMMALATNIGLFIGSCVRLKQLAVNATNAGREKDVKGNGCWRTSQDALVNSLAP